MKALRQYLRTGTEKRYENPDRTAGAPSEIRIGEESERYRSSMQLSDRILYNN
jgi:hypothetical protein